MVRAPNIVGDVWFNTGSLTAVDLRGKIVLYDFWTYSCVNCQRTLPYLKAWWESYKNKNFLLIGIHTPEFEFEKDLKNVEKAIKDLGVTWPVVLDNDYVNWNAFANHYWPAKYLADRDGKIVYTHFGEGVYAETEKKIRGLLGLEDLKDVSKEAQEEHSHGNVCFIPTPETYCGYGRGNPIKGGTPSKDGDIGLRGEWLVEKEYVESQSPGAQLLLRFHATEVNLVLHPVGEKAIIEASFNGQSKEVRITNPTIYNLLRSKELMDGILVITAKEGSFRAYAFTFSGCEH